MFEKIQYYKGVKSTKQLSAAHVSEIHLTSPSNVQSTAQNNNLSPTVVCFQHKERFQQVENMHFHQ